MKYGVFISYAREDHDNIQPIIGLIQSMRKDLVFQDTKDIKPGKLWEPQLMHALFQAKVVIVIWCKHSADSEFVKKEYELAIKDKKDVLPILIDKTPLVRELAAYQWIDFSNFMIDEAPRRKAKHGYPEHNSDEHKTITNHYINEDSLKELFSSLKELKSKINELIPPAFQ